MAVKVRKEERVVTKMIIMGISTRMLVVVYSEAYTNIEGQYWA